MIPYSSSEPLLFQTEPDKGQRTRFQPKGWTTLLGYWQEARKLCQLLDLNRKLRGKPYPWTVNVNIHNILAPPEVRRVWAYACRGLRKYKVAALWVREPSPTNHCNYHLLLASD